MIELNGQPGELEITLQITRAATGKTEEVKLTGYLDPSKLPPQPPEQAKEQ